MIKAVLMAGALSLAAAAGASAQTDPSSVVSSDPSATITTSQFITMASQSDEFEIQEGRMAQSMGHSSAVRQFGAKMVRDHTMTTNNLHKAIMKAGLDVPPPPPLKPQQTQMVAQLQGLSGAAFDKAYLQQQIQSHQEALALQQGYSKNGDVPAIKAASAKTVPIVQRHLDMAMQMQQAMGA